MNKLLSIIIPAYNAEMFIEKCLDSLIVESLKDKVEVLIINDGSKDKTSEIAHKYEKTYPGYFYVIDKANGNYGSVMNVGLQKAKGKYFKTLDSDDWYNQEPLIYFIKSLEDTDADVVISNYVRYMAKNDKYIENVVGPDCEENVDLIITDDLWRKKISTDYNIHSVCYKTELLRKTRIVWPENVFYSDIMTLIWPMPLMKTIRIVHKPVYVYYEGSDDQSMSLKSIKRNFSSYNIVVDRIFDYYKSTYDINSSTRSLQDRTFLYILGQFYSYLTYPDFTNFDTIRQMDIKIKEVPQMYNNLSWAISYRRMHYLDYFRNGRYSPRFLLFRGLMRIKELLSQII